MSKSRREKNRRRRRQQQVRRSTKGSSSPANPLGGTVQATTEEEQTSAGAALAPQPTMFGVEGLFRIPEQLEGGLGLLAILGFVGRALSRLPGAALGVITAPLRILRGGFREAKLVQEPDPQRERMRQIEEEMKRIQTAREKALDRGDLDTSSQLREQYDCLKERLKHLQGP